MGRRAVSACALGAALALAAPAPAATITVAAVGDIMMGSTYPEAWLPPDDGRGMFDAAAPHLRGADVVVGNLEGPLLDGGRSAKCREGSTRCFAFRTPVRYAAHLRDAGFTALHVANNHAHDFGEEGLRSTLAALGREGIGAAGGAHVARATVRGRRVAVLGFSYLESEASLPMRDPAAVEAAVRAAKAGGDLVIVSFHGGAEGADARHLGAGEETFLGEARGDVRRFARTAVDAGADLVLGHGPHVLRALERYRGKLVAYSLGNFLTFGRFNIKGPNGLSAVLRVTLDAGTGDLVEARIVPLRLLEGGLPREDPEGAAVAEMRALTADDLDGGGLEIREDGAILPAPPRP